MKRRAGCVGVAWASSKSAAVTGLNSAVASTSAEGLRKIADPTRSDRQCAQALIQGPTVLTARCKARVVTAGTAQIPSYLGEE